MKAQVLLGIFFLLGLVSAHSISKRSLLRGGGRGHQSHGSHHHHEPQQRQRRLNRRRNQGRFSPKRSGRDGDSHHHQEHPEVRAISTGYLPAASDDYYDYQEDSLPGYGGAAADSRNQIDDSLPGYAEDSLAGYSDNETSTVGADTRDYDYDSTTTQSPDYGEDSEGSGASLDDQYAAPSDVDNSYSAPLGEEYGGPGAGDQAGVSAARNADTDYSPPPPDNDAPQYDSQNGFPFAEVESQSRSGSGPSVSRQRPSGPRQGGRGRSGARQCPGGSIEACVAVCPGYSPYVYGACVGGCADRCPEARVK